MQIKNISVPLTQEEQAALYEAATRECRRPQDQIRFLLRQALGLVGDDVQCQQKHNRAGVRQDTPSAVATN